MKQFDEEKQTEGVTPDPESVETDVERPTETEEVKTEEGGDQNVSES